MKKKLLVACLILGISAVVFYQKDKNETTNKSKQLAAFLAEHPYSKENY